MPLGMIGTMSGCDGGEIMADRVQLHFNGPLMLFTEQSSAKEYG